MKVKSLAITLVLNIFLMLVVSMLLEYFSLSERFALMTEEVGYSLESAVDASTLSEELFTEKYNSYVSSYGADNANRTISGSVLYPVSGKFYRINAYTLANFYSSHGRLPNNASECNSLISSTLSEEQIYSWLYGKVASSYSYSNLSWANKSTSRANNYVQVLGNSKVGKDNSARDPSSNFLRFYNNIGKYQNTVGYVKQKSSSGYNVVLKKFPTLVQMGLNLHSYNSVNSAITSDNFTSSVKVGKSYKNGVVSTSRYYLTPASLGVTYVPVEILKPVFMTNLKSFCALNMISSGGNLENASSVNLTDVEGCIETSVYKNGTNKQSHKKASSEKIINDGQIEYDLNSVNVKVDYFFVDFTNASKRSSNARIISRLRGTISYAASHGYAGSKVESPYSVDQSSTMNNTLDTWLEEDSASKVTDEAYKTLYQSVANKKIVARVTVKLKIHVPYESQLLQYLCYLDEGSFDVNHYGIKKWNETDQSVTVNDDDLWYSYTTYYMSSNK